MLYTYHRVTLTDGTAAVGAAFAAFAAGEARAEARKAGGELLGLFLPQLGFASHERALLFRWPGAPGAPLAACNLIAACSVDRLNATARPADTDQVRPGGIVVHRWFTIAPADRDEFVALSKAAWVEFEADFETQIFGLFAAEPTAEDGASQRMLLMTRYGGHADWEVSRRPGPQSAANFARRHALTRLTRGCSTLLAPLP
jgi:hypothetical protein